MTANYHEISGWFDQGIKQGATHMLIVCDTFDYDDYPIYIMPGEDAREKASSIISQHDMQDLMEVYNLSQDKQTQMDEHRVFNY